MEPKKEITFFIKGLSGSDKEKLLSVLVLAEIRLNTSWVLLEQPENASVCFCNGGIQKADGHSGPVIQYGGCEQAQQGADEQNNLFHLPLDASNMPSFSNLISVLNQVEAWLLSHPKVAIRTEKGHKEDKAEDVQAVAATATPVVQAASTAPVVQIKEPLVPDVSQIPTLVPVDEDISLEVSSTTASSGTLPELPDMAIKLPWLDQIAEYLDALPAEAVYHKILLQSGEVILIDLDQNCFYSSIEIEAFLSRSRDNKTSFISALDRQDFINDLSKQYYIQRPFSNLQWFLALYSNVHGLDIDTDTRSYLLTAWPGSELPGLHRDHLKLAAFMRAKRASLAEIAAETGISLGQIRSFVEACHYEGLVQTDVEPEVTHERAPDKPKGLWGRMLKKIRR